MTTRLANAVRGRPLVAFFVLAYALTWPLIPLVSVSPLLGFPALFGPAAAATIVAAVADGKPGLRDLLGRMVRWRVGARRGALVRGGAGSAGGPRAHGSPEVGIGPSI